MARRLRLLLVVLILSVTLTPAASAGVRCFGSFATIVGTEDSEEIIGTRQRDVIVGRGGNDVIRGRGGGDTICGNAGHDELYAARGFDGLFGGRGNDLLRGGRGGDLLAGDRGRDREFGGPGRDHLGVFALEQVQPRPDHGDDILDGGPGRDALDLDSSPGPMNVDLSSGVADGAGHDVIAVGTIETVFGGPYDDTVIGDDRDNWLAEQTPGIPSWVEEAATGSRSARMAARLSGEKAETTSSIPTREATM